MLERAGWLNAAARAVASIGEKNNPLGELCALGAFASFEKMLHVDTSSLAPGSRMFVFISNCKKYRIVSLAGWASSLSRSLHGGREGFSTSAARSREAMQRQVHDRRREEGQGL